MSATHQCQARALAGTFQLPHSKEICGLTKECCLPAIQKVYVDSGDAHLYICADHLQKFKNRSAALPFGWLGWFDCSYPAGVRVKYSEWYWQKALEIFRAQNPKLADAFIPIGTLRGWMEGEIQKQDADAAAVAADAKEMKRLTKSFGALSVN